MHTTSVPLGCGEKITKKSNPQKNLFPTNRAVKLTIMLSAKTCEWKELSVQPKIKICLCLVTQGLMNLAHFSCVQKMHKIDLVV